jgi:hypothetical protein
VGATGGAGRKLKLLGAHRGGGVWAALAEAAPEIEVAMRSSAMGSTAAGIVIASIVVIVVSTTLCLQAK